MAREFPGDHRILDYPCRVPPTQLPDTRGTEKDRRCAMETVMQDVRFGARTLVKNPGFTLVAVLALALGIGANSAIFSVVNAVLLQPLPYPDPDRLVSVWEGNTRKGSQMPLAPANFVDWNAQNEVFENAAAFMRWSFNVTGQQEPERVRGVLLSANAFALLGVQPILGRTFLPEEGAISKNRVVVLSHGLWQRRFGGDPGAIGSTLALDGNSHTVIGVMPPSFGFPLANQTFGPDESRASADLWTPLAFAPDDLLRDNHYLAGIARLRPGVSIEQAQAEMDAIGKRLAEQYPESNENIGMKLVPLREQVVGNARVALLVLLGSVGLVLLIACVNVANLLVAKAAERQREIAIRTALGASRMRVVRQLLTESILLSSIGGVLGLLLALWGVDLLVALAPDALPRVEEIRTDWRVLGFTVAVSLATGVLFGLAPALQASRPNLNDALKGGGIHSTPGTGRQRFRNALTASEIALALVLLMKSFLRLQHVDPGFDPHNIVTAQLSLPSAKYPEGLQVRAFVEQLLDRIDALPGVQAAGVVSHLPLSGDDAMILFTIEGRPPRVPGEDSAWAQVRSATPNYFQAMSIPLLRGRQLAPTDTKSTPNVALVNEELARRYWPGEDPIGKRFTFNEDDEGQPIWREIVGVIRGVRHTGLEKEPGSQMYIPFGQGATSDMALAVRTASSPESTAAALRAEVLAVDKDQPVSNVATMTEVVSAAVAKQRFTTLLLAIFAGLAALLAGVGIYGVISFSVSQRTHEIGIRMAMGARGSDVLRLIVGESLVVALVGLVVGLAAAFALTRTMASLLFEVNPTDPLTFAGISLLLAAVAALASYLPARRAVRVDPMVVLRYE
jgi:putative ABC transport system permease protein